MWLYVLDAPVFLWWLTDDERLGEKTKLLIADQRNRVALSAATLWEVVQMTTIGLIKGISNIQQVIEDEGVEVICPSFRACRRDARCRAGQKFCCCSGADRGSNFNHRW